MSTDTEVDPVEQWEDVHDLVLDELMRIVREAGRKKDTDPAFHAFMTRSIARCIGSATADLRKLMDLQTARQSARGVNIVRVPLPLSDLAKFTLDCGSLTGNAREWATPYLQALTTHEEGQTHYGADTVESLIAYALSGMGRWEGETAETVKAMFESYLPACQRED